MSSKELLSKIRAIEIKARGMSKQLFSGNYASSFKGKGMTFAEVREYQIGDETRIIDWNVTARFNEPFVKTFEEEREQTVMVVFDVSASESFGTLDQNKRAYLTEVCAVLAFSAISNNDKVGVIFCTDVVEKFIPPRKGKNHILRIIKDLLEFEPKHTKTDISAGLKQLTNALKRRSTAFLISDFIDNNYFHALKAAAAKHDLIAINCFDPMEEALPKLGMIKMIDPETKAEKWVNTSSKTTRENYKKWRENYKEIYKEHCKKLGIDNLYLNTSEDYILPLMRVFKKRAK